MTSPKRGRSRAFKERVPSSKFLGFFHHFMEKNMQNRRRLILFLDDTCSFFKKLGPFLSQDGCKAPVGRFLRVPTQAPVEPVLPRPLPNDASGFLSLFVSNHSMNRSRLCTTCGTKMYASSFKWHFFPTK